MPTTEELQRTIAQLEEQLVTLQERYEEAVPIKVKRLIIILGIAALLKKPWMILLAIAQYKLFAE
jgi:hypothetical protein